RSTSASDGRSTPAPGSRGRRPAAHAPDSAPDAGRGDRPPGPTPIGMVLAAVENGFSRTFGESGPAVGGTPGGRCLSSWQYAMSFPLLPVPRELEVISMALDAHGIKIHMR